MVLPVVIRELQVRSRSPATFYIRVAAAAALTLLTWLFGSVFPANFRGAGSTGNTLLLLLGFLLLLLCLFEGLRTAAGGVCQERRDGTLGLLFLTDLTGLDVLLGHLAGAALNAAYSLIATVPVLGVLVLFGGVTPGELLRTALALLTGLALALACGTWASTRSRDGMSAILVASSVLLGVFLVPMLADLVFLAGTTAGNLPTLATFSLPSPILSWMLIDDVSSRTAAGRFWVSLGFQLTVAAGLVLHAARHLERTWRQPERLDSTASVRLSRTPVPLDINPDAVIGRALTRRINLRRWWPILIVLSVLLQTAKLVPSLAGGPASYGSMIALQLPMALTALIRSLLVCFLAARIFSEARPTGELELLLTTGLSPRRLIDLLWERLRTLVISLVAVDVAFGLVSLTVILLTGGSTVPFQTAIQTVASVGSLAAGAAQWWAIVWVALWFGLTCRNTHRAVGKTMGLVVVGTSWIGGLVIVYSFSLVSKLFSSPGSGLFLLQISFSSLASIAAFAGWTLWAKRQLASGFRSAAAAAGMAG